MARPCTASVSQLPSGRFSVRITHSGGKRTRLGPYDTEEEAHAKAVEARTAVARPPGGPTLKEFGPRWLDDRHKTGQ